MNRWLKIKVLLLSLIFPVSGFIIGLSISYLNGNEKIISIYALSFMGGGILLDFICFFSKIFSFIFYRIPIPVLISLIAYDIALIFTTRLNSLFAGIGGLVLGILITLVLIRPGQFYVIRKRFLVIVYLFLSLLLVGLLQGIPAVNILLGVIAGNYISFRYMDAIQPKKRIRRNFIISAIFTSVVLLINVAISGFLLLNDSVNIERAIFQVTKLLINNTQLYRIIIFGGIILVFVQFWLTYYSAWILYQYRVAKRILENNNH
jgi:hypothetical protein